MLPSEASVNLIDLPEDRNSLSPSSFEVHLRCSRRGRCHSALVSRYCEKVFMVWGSIGMVLSGKVTVRISLEDYRHQVVGVTDSAGIMHGIDKRSGSAKKHYIWNRL